MTEDLQRPLNGVELNRLALVLDEGERAVGYAFTEGMLVAIASAPSAISPHEWLAWVLPDQEWGSKDEYAAVIYPLIRLLNSLYAGLGQGEISLWTRIDDDSELVLWCIGYLAGVDLDPIWSGTPVFGAPSLKPWRSAAGELPPREALGCSLDDLREQLPAAVMDMHAFWLEWRLAGEDPDDHRPIHSIRIGRNEPCPCGSGRKYKHCCRA